MQVFQSANILLPKNISKEWPVIACDQFTSQPAYWESVEDLVGTRPSAFRMILPESRLNGPCEEYIEKINRTMDGYLKEDIFAEYPQSYIYVERTLCDGSIRKGIVGMVDLEDYDYAQDAVSKIRATEKTVVSRIPPRKKVRRDASLELPHILLLCDDAQRRLIESCEEVKEQLPLLYDLELMKNGGHIRGWLLQGEAAAAFDAELDRYGRRMEETYHAVGKAPMFFAVGDGNHSLATAKACYEEVKVRYGAETAANHPSRYALVELENIHDDAQQFEAIHRIVTGVDVRKLLDVLQEACGAEEGIPITWYSGKDSGTICLNTSDGQLPVAILQKFLDEYQQKEGGEIDYIHGEEAVQELAGAEGAVGFLLPAMGKEQLFPGIIMGGVLPRKTFSMGHAQEKRYYMEARRIR